MKNIAAILMLLAAFWPVISQAQITEEGELKDHMRIGRHVWKDQNGQIKAEVVYDEAGVVQSYRTWDNAGLLYDDVRLDAKRKREELPELPFAFDEDGFGYVLIHGTAAKDAPSARQGERVGVFYQGLLQDGTVFDTNFGGKKPFKFRFQMHEVVEGFDRAVSMLKVGEEGYFWVPAKLAYGENVAGKIPPFSDLLFRIKLVDLN